MEGKADRALAELLNIVETTEPLIPDAITKPILNQAGFACDDLRVQRVISLAAQKFVTDIATDALHYSKQNGDKKNKTRKMVLTVQDLSQALAEYGIKSVKPEYYAQ